MNDGPSRYRDPASAPDYGHGFHAGNVGDAWKHLGLVEALRLSRPADGPMHYVESHAGEGRYRLGSTGEWSAGVERVAAAVDAAPPGAPEPVARWIELCRRLGYAGRSSTWAGSPEIARTLLGPGDRLSLRERDPRAHASLARLVADDPRVRVSLGDGLAALAEEARAAESAAASVLVLVDPPWTAKEDWIRVPDALADAVAATTRATFLLWYPVKSLTRPNAMLARLASRGLRSTVAELVTTPLELRRGGLNGSGLLAVRPPDGWTASMAASAPFVGAACATRRGAWSLRLLDSGDPPTGA